MHHFGHMPNRSDLKKAINLLYANQGFHKLNIYQQRLMVTAIRIQHRLDKHLAASKKGASHKYYKSWEFLTDINCHKSVYCVEQKISFKNMPPYTPDSFFSYYNHPKHSCHIYLQALTTVLLAGTPCIVHIKHRYDDFTPTHTFIALGWSKQINDIYLLKAVSHPTTKSIQFLAGSIVGRYE